MTKTLDKTIRAGLILEIEASFQAFCNYPHVLEKTLTDAIEHATKSTKSEYSSVLGAYDYNMDHAINAWKSLFFEGAGSTERHVSDQVTSGLIEDFKKDLIEGSTPEAPQEAPQAEADPIDELKKTLDKKNIVLNAVTRLTNPKDSFLFYVLAYSERKGEHIVWLYNTQTKGLTNGYYTNDKDQAIKRYNTLTA